MSLPVVIAEFVSINDRPYVLRFLGRKLTAGQTLISYFNLADLFRRRSLGIAA